MMSKLIRIVVFLALVASSYALACTECVSPSVGCSGPRVTCPTGSQCGALLSKTETNGSISTLYVMSCLPQNECGFSGSATLPFGVKMKMGASCCSTDGCIPYLPSLPWDSSGSNGLTCRSCMSADSTWCYTSETMQCSGDENMCLLQTTKVTGATKLSTAVRGCATKSICDFGSQSYSAGGQSVAVKFICTSGSTSLREGFLLPAVICLFLLKLLN